MRAAKYRRNGWWTVKVPHPAGGVVALSAKTKDDTLASNIVTMCNLLMEQPANHDLLVWVCEDRYKLRVLYAHWVQNKLDVLRHQATDVDLASYLADWRGFLITHFGEPDAASHTVNRYHRQVTAFFAFCGSTKLSTLTARNATRWIASATTVATGTRARYWAALKSFIKYLESLDVIGESPIAKLKAPPLGDARDRHLSHDEMWRLIEAAPGKHRVAQVLAHLGMELSAVRRVRRADVDLEKHTILARGTKRKKGRKNYRTRRCHIHQWAQAEMERACAGLAPNDLLVPLSDLVIQKKHVALCETLGFDNYRFHDARHTYAVAMVKAGTPSRVVGKQLGHKDGQQVERVYGNYAPTMQELEYWAEREQATRADKQPQLQKQIQATFSPSISGQDVCLTPPEKEAKNGRGHRTKRDSSNRTQRWSSTNSLTFFVGPQSAVVTR